MKTVCVNHVQHKVNNPLTVISMIIELNENNLSKKDFKIITDSINRISSFTKGLHDEKDMAQHGESDKNEQAKK